MTLAMVSDDDFLVRLEAITPGVVEQARKANTERTRKRSLADQVREDVAELAEASESVVLADAAFGLRRYSDEPAERLPRFVPEIGKRLCGGCGRMLAIARFEGPSRRCRVCGDR